MPATTTAAYLLLTTALLHLAGASYEGPLEWWQTTVVYQIYPRSFMDSDGNGIGDLNGITSRADYLKELGVGTVWLSPIFKSPMVDFGYDIQDYKSIDPLYGTMEDFKRLKLALRERGIRLIVDYVPNHSSNKHEWFRRSVNREHPYTDFYVWRNPSGWDDNNKPLPPTNWRSVFGGDAWTWNEKRKQFYYHAFAIEQPDLNYRNKLLRREMMNNLRFWLDLGVDGFRVDAVSYFMEDILFRNEPVKLNYTSTGPGFEYEGIDHIYTTHRPESYDVVCEMRTVLDEYKKRDGQPRVMLVEIYTNITNINKTMGYYGTPTKPGSHLPNNFLLVNRLVRKSSARDYVNVILEWMHGMPSGGWANWIMSNHDNSRIPSKLGPETVDGINMLNLLLPGTALSYYGEEIGMADTAVRWDQTIDPMGVNAGERDYLLKSRDAERTPFQWDNSTFAGFTKGNKSWLPVNPDYWINNYEEQRKSEQSHFKVFQRLIQLRATPTIQRGDMFTYILSNWTFAITRVLKGNDTYVIVFNVGSDIEWHLVHGKIANISKVLTVHTAGINTGYKTGDVILPSELLVLRPKAAIVLTTATIPMPLLEFTENTSHILKLSYLTLFAIVVHGFL